MVRVKDVPDPLPLNRAGMPEALLDSIDEEPGSLPRFLLVPV